MQLAYITADQRGAIDVCLEAAVALLSAEGLRLAGGVQQNIERPGRTRCDMALKLLPDGPLVRISQDLGSMAEGCRLDAEALEEAVAEVAQHLSAAQALVVNKFGKQELIGHGFVPLIAEALGDGKPVLVGVAAGNLEGFLRFAGEIAVALPADPVVAARWMSAACAELTGSCPG